MTMGGEPSYDDTWQEYNELQSARAKWMNGDSEEPECIVPACSSTTLNDFRPFCSTHWAKLPLPVREQLAHFIRHSFGSVDYEEYLASCVDIALGRKVDV